VDGATKVAVYPLSVSVTALHVSDHDETPAELARPIVTVEEAGTASLAGGAAFQVHAQSGDAISSRRPASPGA
jgi:hypothetical protein